MAVDLDRSWTEFRGLVARAALELEHLHLEAAAVGAQVAATHAWFNHPGVFASSDLEAVVLGVGRQLREGPPAVHPVSGVLHVATELYGTGGHTRMLVNWILADTGRDHHVCLTGQRGRAVPDVVVEALAGRGTVTVLDDDHDRLLDRARALRSLAAGASTVVLHVHPHDVVPGIALARRPRAPSVLAVDHADHVFWVGTTTPDVVVHLRHSGALLGRVRRGIAPDRSTVLLRPLALASRSRTREEARAALGVPPGRVLLVTAAAGSKYDPVDGLGFHDLLGPVLEAHPDAYLLAAGPDPVGEWATWEARGLGRAVGLLPDVRTLLEAADVYADSYPFASLTSMLEAAALGVPVVTLRHPDREEADVLGADTPELDEVMVVGPTPEAYRRALAGLVVDARARESLGDRTGRAVATAHADGAWARKAAQVLDRPPGPRPTPGGPAPDVRRTGVLDHRVAQLQAQSGWGSGVEGARLLNASLLPLGRRLALAAGQVRAGRRPRVVELVSARTARRLRGARARVRRGARAR